jgi:hypothetical protein
MAKFAIAEGASLAIHQESIFQTDDAGVKVLSLQVFMEFFSWKAT